MNCCITKDTKILLANGKFKKVKKLKKDDALYSIKVVVCNATKENTNG